MRNNTFTLYSVESSSSENEEKIKNNQRHFLIEFFKEDLAQIKHPILDKIREGIKNHPLISLKHLLELIQQSFKESTSKLTSCFELYLNNVIPAIPDEIKVIFDFFNQENFNPAVSKKDYDQLLQLLQLIKETFFNDNELRSYHDLK